MNNINCSELDNITISYDYFLLIKQIGEDLIKYLREYRQISQEYNKKLQILENNLGKKLSKSDDPKMAHIIDIQVQQQE